MTVEAIAAIGATQNLVPDAAVSATQHIDASSFVQWIDAQVASTDAKIKAADQAVQNVALGKTDNLHRVMMDIESARMSLDLVVQIRNRVVDAYQELMRMQI
jgi:flagellar hook-basal body complex protein FliE